MEGVITVAVLGVVICVIGIINMMGNISSVHAYHRKRVSEENRKAFGRLVGIGTLVIGISMNIYAALLLVFELTGLNAPIVVGTVELIVGIIVGTIISIRAMKKYNGGIF